MKRKYSYIGLSFIILIFGIIFIPKIVERLSHGTVVDKDKMTGKTQMEKTNPTPLSYIVLNGEKQKAPAFKFVDQHNDTITNNNYEGKVYVVEFFFTTCPTICPIMNDNLVQVAKEFKGNKNFGIASFTIDPNHDTPEVLKKYADAHQVTNPNWHFMTGDQSAIFKLANQGYKFNAEENPNAQGGFLHSGMFALVDKEGYLRSRTDEFGNPLIYYRGYLKEGTVVDEGDEEPQINILVEDIKKLF